MELDLSDTETPPSWNLLWGPTEKHLPGASPPPPSEEEMIQENLSSKVQGELCSTSQIKAFPSYQEPNCLDWSELERNWPAGIEITEASGDWLAQQFCSWDLPRGDVNS